MNIYFVLQRYAVSPKIFKSITIFLIFLFFPFGGLISVWAAPATKILVLGDSLAAGYGLLAGQSFPARLEVRLRSIGHNVRVLNGGVSGDTSAGGRARLSWALADKPNFVIIELGANDGLRGLDPVAMRDNLEDIILRLKAVNIGILLTGMRAPPNIGPNYGRAFNSVFSDLAQKHEVPLYPFFLEGVAAIPGLNQRDGIHPNSRGVAVIVDRITPFVVRLLEGQPKVGIN